MGPLVTLCVSEGPGSRPGKPHAIRAGEQVLLSTRTVTALSGKLQMGGRLTRCLERSLTAPGRTRSPRNTPTHAAPLPGSSPRLQTSSGRIRSPGPRTEGHTDSRTLALQLPTPSYFPPNTVYSMACTF